MIQQGMLLGNRYEIQGIIGTGGMADVYKAKDRVLDRFVAVKVLKGELCNDANLIERFRAEAKAAARLSHPNIVRVFDVDSQAGIHYIVMELVEGVTLKKYIERKGKVPSEEAVMIVLHVLAGMEAAHQNGIIHRDIKPQNIIISMNGEVKVTDFGIARVSSNQTISINTLGSVHYSSPEQARGAHSDFRTDIYSLGVTLYEMVTGRVPFDGESTVAIALMHLQDAPVRPSVYNSNISTSLEKIILKCMQKSPTARYQSTTALAADLKMALSDGSGNFVTTVSPPAGAFGATKNISADERQEIEREFRKSAQTKEQAPLPPKNGRQAPQGSRPQAHGNHQLTQGRMNSSAELEETEEDSEISPKLDRIMTVGMIIIGVIIIAILVFIVMHALGFGKKKSETTSSPSTVSSGIVKPSETKIKVPDFKGKTLAEGLRMVDGKLTLLQAGTEHSDEIESGRIISQDVAVDSEVKPNTEIKLIVSSGKKPEEKKTATVPAVTGYWKGDAVAALEQVGLIAEIVEEYSDTVEEGKVISSGLPAGTVVELNTMITIVISKGKESVTIPSVTGLTIEGARTVLEAAGFKLGDIQEKEAEQEKGMIISQSPTADTRADKGTAVVVVISSGPKKPEEEPQEQEITVKVDINAPIGYVEGDPLTVQIGDSTQTLAAPGSMNVTGKKGSSLKIIVKDDKGHQYEKEVKFE